MKVDVITLHNVSNYGSCLQAYATQTLFKQLGCEVEIIDYYRKDILPEAQIEHAFNGHALGRFHYLWEKAPWLKELLSYPIGGMLEARRRPFEEFRQQYLNLTRPYTSADQLVDDPPSADIYCTGSDQVWNSIWNQGFDDAFYLGFAPEGKKRIAFSASIGRDVLDEWEIPLMKEALSKYQAISLREISGIKLLDDLGFPEVRLVLDPTLMLTRDNWLSLSTMPASISKPYLLVYQLNDDSRFDEYVVSMRRRYGLDVVKVSYLTHDCKNYAKNVVAPAVTDFLGLLLNASYVVTDSFHATAFSLNCGMPFTSIAPARFSTRIKSVLELTEQQDRLLTDINDVEMFERPVDFRLAQDKLQEMREKSLTFLESAIAD